MYKGSDNFEVNRLNYFFLRNKTLYLLFPKFIISN